MIAGCAQVAQLRRTVRAQLLAGVPFEQVEAEVIDPVALDWEAKDALWLYGWSLAQTSKHRADAHAQRALADAFCSPPGHHST